MVSFTVCDDCRYGMANYKAATVLFDLGTGATPSFVDESKDFDANLIQGGFTFKAGTQQYLVAASLGTNPCANNKSGLYQFNDIDDADIPLLECLDVGGTGTEIINGISVEGTNPQVLYMADRFDRFRIFQVHTSPTFGLNYVGNGGIERANMGRGYGIDIDEAAGVMAVANAGNLYVYDVGHTSGSPVSPILKSTTAMPGLTSANAVGLKYPVVHVAQQFVTDEPQTFDVSNLTNPVSLDQQFWDPSHAWNSLGDCIWNNHAIFSDDGAALYLSRYSTLQVIDPTACAGPVEPVANLTLSPQPAFPGDLLTVTNTSLSGDRFATWITDGPDAHGGTILAGTHLARNGDRPRIHPAGQHGQRRMSSTPTPRSRPMNIPMFRVRPRTRSRPWPIVIDRTPEAVITITPAAVVTGDSVSLSVAAEGHPGVVGGGDPFEWTVTDPSGTPDQLHGDAGQRGDPGPERPVDL